MKCFTHPGDDAVALCRNCGKGLCPACAKQTESGMACEGRCSAELEKIGAIMWAGTEAHRINRGGAAYFQPVFLVALGLLFLVEPLLSGRPPRTFPVVMGSAFTLFGVVLGLIQFVWRRRLAARPQAGRP